MKSATRRSIAFENHWNRFLFRLGLCAGPRFAGGTCDATLDPLVGHRGAPTPHSLPSRHVLRLSSVLAPLFVPLAANPGDTANRIQCCRIKISRRH